ncbi:MAG: GNAT family N-acetyltransferase [Tabrizicola sp.]|nr:GNAT family N-acetyltransferase [Paracoccaceae bacterium]MDZ4067254.1 GNAT family N-acetyltransferase [Tabrizicola sp.]
MVTVHKGLPSALRWQGARLYWEAFGAKLGRVLGPEDRALAFFDRVMRGDHCVIALDTSGALLGLAGFKTIEGSFAGGTWADLRAVYGQFGGLWRGASLWALSREVDNDRFLMDGLCVTASVRGQGVGTALLQAICDEALVRGYPSVRLDVVDTNVRARQLYEREGFVATRTQRLGLLRYLFGFAATITMVRPLRS